MGKDDDKEQVIGRDAEEIDRIVRAVHIKQQFKQDEVVEISMQAVICNMQIDDNGQVFYFVTGVKENNIIIFGWVPEDKIKSI